MSPNNCDACGNDRSMCDCKKSASDYQIGGEHYRADYQHWDWAIDVRLGYLESAASKYVTRWKGKNGVEDVQKGIHYLTKAKEAFQEERYMNRSTLVGPNAALASIGVMNTQKFCHANNLDVTEENFMLLCACWQNSGDLDAAIGFAERILRMAEEAQEARKDGAGTNTPGNPSTAPQAAKTGAAGRAAGATAQAPASSTSTDVVNSGKTDHPAPFGYDGDE